MATPSRARRASTDDTPGSSSDENRDADGEPSAYWRHVGLAILAGMLATVAALRSPVLGPIPPIVPPYFPVDLRLITLPISFGLTQAMAPRMGWPGRATATLGLIVLSSLLAHVHASAALSFAGIGWAEPGTSVDLIAMAATLGSLLLGLAIALGTGRDRFARRARRRGIPAEQIEAARALAERVRSNALTTAGLAIAVLSLAMTIVDEFVGGESLPLAEVVALAVVLALGAVLLGVQGREDVPG